MGTKLEETKRDFDITPAIELVGIAVIDSSNKSDIKRQLERPGMIPHYSDFSKLNQQLNSENSQTTNSRMQRNPEEWIEYHRLYREARKGWRIIPIETARKLDEKKIDAVSKLIHEITVNLDTVGYDPITYKEKAMEWGIGLEEAERLSQFFDIDSIEGPIVNEISFLYYLNLNDEWYFHTMNDSRERPLYERPLLCLLAILKEDSEIQEWFAKLIGDIVKYQEGVMQSMREFYDRISRFR